MTVMIEVLTISLAGIIDSGKVLVAAALVGTLSVVADVGTHSKLLTLVLICQTPQGHAIHIKHSFKSADLKQTAAITSYV